MRVFRQEEPDFGKDAATFAIGALGGLALGMLISRRAPQPRVSQLGSDLRERVRSAGEKAKTAARRLQPARLRRMAGEQAELTDLEDRVLDAFLADAVLGERGIDVGAISHGIIELSGSVWTEAESDHAMQVANTVPGVRTVVNRMEVESEARQLEEARRRAQAEEDEGLGESRWSGRMIGMNRRRQGHQTDPDRPDDSQQQEDEALREADVAQWREEGLAAKQPRKTESVEAQSRWRTDYEEDELDNQDPHGKHAARTLDEQPQELNTSARVGEGLKSGTHLRMEDTDLPGKPHGERGAAGESRSETAE